MSNKSTRSVKLKVTSQKELITGEVSARTFGELKSELKNVKWDGMRVVVRETKNTLQDDGALLPAGDFVLFLVPEKVKSGMGKLKRLKNIATASYNDLRSHGSYLNSKKNAGLDLSGGTEQIRKTIQGYYDEMNPAKAAEAPAETPGNVNDAVAIIEKAGGEIKEAIAIILANAGEAKAIVEDTTEYVLKVTVEDLDTELADLKKALKL